VLPSDSILGVRTTGCHHLVESSNAVTLLELDNVLADFVDDAGDVVTLVGVIEFRQPP